MKKSSRGVKSAAVLAIIVSILAIIATAVWLWLVYSPAPTEPPALRSAVDAYLRSKEAFPYTTATQCSHLLVASLPEGSKPEVLYIDVFCSAQIPPVNDSTAASTDGLSAGSSSMPFSASHFPARITLTSSDGIYTVQQYAPVYFGESGSGIFAPAWVAARYRRIGD